MLHTQQYRESCQHRKMCLNQDSTCDTNQLFVVAAAAGGHGLSGFSPSAGTKLEARGESCSAGRTVQSPALRCAHGCNKPQSAPFLN